MSDIAQKYIDAGWSVVRLVKGEKRADASWPTKTYEANEFDANDGVAIKCGEPSGWLVDIDLDCSEAIAAANALLPMTGLVHGRASKPSSHRWFICRDIKTKQFTDINEKGAMLVEIRSTGGITAVPPSINPSGEVLTWETQSAPLLIEPDDLASCVRDVAIATLLARHWPGHGATHVAIGPLAGFLCRAGVVDVVRILATAATIAGSNVRDVTNYAQTTVSKFRKGEKVTGGPTLEEHFDKAVVRKMRSWLQTPDEAAVEEGIERLNQHHFIVACEGQMAVADTSRDDRIQLWPFDEFKKKFSKEFVPGPKRPQPLADVWIKDSRGRRYDQLTFSPPGAPRPAGEGDYNGWRGFAVTPAKGNWGRMRRHIQHVICGNDPCLEAWVLNWCASLLQLPGRHARTALVLKGGQGVGKGVFVEDLLCALFPRLHQIVIHNPDHFYGKHNQHLAGKCLVFLDEATWGGRKNDAAILKGRVTGHQLTIEPKFINSFQLDSMLHIVIASNENWPVGVDPDDRRFCCLDIKNDRAKDPQYFEPLYEELHNGGREAFLHAMLHEWTVNEVMVSQAPETQAKLDLKERSLDSVASWWQNCLLEGQLYGGLDIVKGKLTNDPWPSHVGRGLLYQNYKNNSTRSVDPRVFGKELRKWCPSMQSDRVKKNGPRAYRFPSLEQARLEFEGAIGHRVEWDE